MHRQYTIGAYFGQPWHACRSILNCVGGVVIINTRYNVLTHLQGDGEVFDCRFLEEFLKLSMLCLQNFIHCVRVYRLQLIIHYPKSSLPFPDLTLLNLT